PARPHCCQSLKSALGQSQSPPLEARAHSPSRCFRCAGSVPLSGCSSRRPQKGSKPPLLSPPCHPKIRAVSSFSFPLAPTKQGHDITCPERSREIGFSGSGGQSKSAQGWREGGGAGLAMSRFYD